MANGTPVGCVVCKIDEVEEEGKDPIEVTSPLLINQTISTNRVQKVGYLGMLAVDKSMRKAGIGTSLSVRALERMRRAGCKSVVLETEVCNQAAMHLYERLGFIREELLVKYYLNWGNAYRLRLWFS